MTTAARLPSFAPAMIGLFAVTLGLPACATKAKDDQATFGALAKAYPKAPKVARATIRRLLRGAAHREKHAETKAAMDTILKDVK